MKSQFCPEMEKINILLCFHVRRLSLSLNCCRILEVAYIFTTELLLPLSFAFPYVFFAQQLHLFEC